MDHLNGRSPFVADLLNRIASGHDRAYASVIIEAELLAGCRTGGERDRAWGWLDQFIVLPAGREEAVLPGEYRRRFGLQGMLLPDAFIAATAILAALPLVTRNIRHFRHIPDLALVEP
jgi:predicted nucleic acid-binding protein